MASVPWANTFTHFTSPAAGRVRGRAREEGSILAGDILTFQLPKHLLAWKFRGLPMKKMDRFKHNQITNNGMWQS